MDPDACLRRALDALRAGDRAEFVLAMEDLIGWIDRGGFLPKDPRINPALEAAMAAAEHLRETAAVLIKTAETYEEAVRNRPTR